MKQLQTSRSLFGWVLIAAGFAVIGAGWAGVQSTPVVAVQLSYLASGGFVGIGLIMVGTGLLAWDDVREGRRILEELRDRFDDIEFDLDDLKANSSADNGRRPRIGKKVS